MFYTILLFMTVFNNQAAEPAPAAHSRCEQCLLDAERLLGVQITLHDLAGIFHDPAGAPLLGPRRHSHRRFSICANTPKDYCLRHCRDQMALLGAQARAPFTHICRRGLREIVAPVQTREGSLLGLLFAGFWRAGKIPRTIGREDLAEFKRLPPWNAQQAERLGRVLQILAMGLLAEVDQLFKINPHPATRKAAILQYLKHQAGQPVKLRDLARALALSPSRTSHLVKTLFGKSFQTLLLEERLARAKFLLFYTDNSVKEIAQRVGMPNEYYFNRTFHRLTGCPPGRYRQGRPRGSHLHAGAYFMEML